MYYRLHNYIGWLVKVVTRVRFQIRSKNTQSKNISFNLNGNIIKTEDEVKLCGVTIDYELKFNSRITNICRNVFFQGVYIILSKS
jgi:hypothetical protein